MPNSFHMLKVTVVKARHIHVKRSSGFPFVSAQSGLTSTKTHGSFSITLKPEFSDKWMMRALVLIFARSNR